MINTNKKYPRTVNIYRRDSEGNFTDEWVRPPWEEYYEEQWDAYEKVDGINIRIVWDGEKISFGGRSDKVKIFPHLLEYLEKTFSDPRWFQKYYPNGIILFGEGFGKKIQASGPLYLPDRVSFCLFDAFTDTWLPQEEVTVIALELRLPRAPKIGTFTLKGLEWLITEGPRITSRIGQRPSHCEGVVARLVKGSPRERIMVKLKYEDYRKEHPLK